MSKHWIFIVVAACFEIGWVIGLKHASTIMEWGLTVVAILASFVLLIAATAKLPVATAYAVFVGLGTAGTVIAETLLFGEPFELVKALLIGLLLTGVIGLKLVTPGEKPKPEKGVS
ncbi:small multidrug resistance protein [Niallia circulans]|jgi:paired small multidrug resistance pump|uniref:DMT family transporter n=1 Tax=Shouchella clausii TaxID=79880 RepID=UPI000BA6C562|nr:multidrug efflux SMR transporter [Shouchella clausii]MCM3548070.1 multidrug efflux SMR transporter [Shouchella clausii]PAF15260.1 QacE family quaternary ammonium compound efflux SMR transporter [Shouchella clausii]SPU17855.1 small multidrug resistance protein [Niallia circulans]